MRLSTTLLLTFVCAALALADSHQRIQQQRRMTLRRSAPIHIDKSTDADKKGDQDALQAQPLQQHKANVPVKQGDPLFTHVHFHQTAPVSPGFESGGSNSTGEPKGSNNGKGSKGSGHSKSSSSSSFSSSSSSKSGSKSGSGAESESSSTSTSTSSSTSSDKSSDSSSDANSDASKQDKANVAMRPGGGGLYTESHTRPAVKRQARLSNVPVRPGGQDFTEAHTAGSGSGEADCDDADAEEDDGEGAPDAAESEKKIAAAATTAPIGAVVKQARDAAMGYGYQTHSARACNPASDPKCSWGKRVTARVPDSALPLTAASFAVTHGKVNRADPHADSMLSRGRERRQ